MICVRRIWHNIKAIVANPPHDYVIENTTSIVQQMRILRAPNRNFVEIISQGLLQRGFGVELQRGAAPAAVPAAGGQPLQADAATIEHYRQRIVEFERRALTQKR